MNSKLASVAFGKLASAPAWAETGPWYVGAGSGGTNFESSLFAIEKAEQFVFDFQYRF